MVNSLDRFQNVVLGGGEAGKYIAWELARWGQRVAVVERALIGGSCPNIACLPSKNVIHSAKVVDSFAMPRHSDCASAHGPLTWPAYDGASARWSTA
jgi:pyruvate/2-oxoglutarate dehydrogenase complex dihydrolipoamide dehydrogenase (E3) component